MFLVAALTAALAAALAAALTETPAAAVKTATEVEVRAIQDHKVIEWNTCWKCRLSEDTDDI